MGGGQKVLAGGPSKPERTGRKCCGGLVATEHSGTELVGESIRGTRRYALERKSLSEGTSSTYVMKSQV